MGVRIDKWLWAARFFKTRSLAGHACDLGRVEANGVPMKPAREVRVGETLKVKTEAAVFEIEVLELSEVRGPAADARRLYSETLNSVAERRKAAEMRKADPFFESFREGRPTKRDRRQMTRLRGRG
jgi:ribosome-associated heat shock protein Hsp15